MPLQLCCLTCRSQIRGDWALHAETIRHRQQLSMQRRRGQRLQQHVSSREPSPSTYVLGCSCPGCCAAHADYHARYRAARKARELLT